MLFFDAMLFNCSNNSGVKRMVRETFAPRKSFSILNTVITSYIHHNLKQKLGDYYKDEKWLFSKWDGTLIGTDRPNAWLDEVLKKANLPHFKVHSLRHTNITLQITGGVPLITVSGRAGHSRTSTTTDIYSHFIKTSDSNASEILEKILEGNDSKPKEKSELSSLLQLKKKLKDLGIESIEELIKLL